MVAEEFLRQIGAEMEWAAQRENLERSSGAVEAGACRGDEEERGLGAEGREGGGLHVELGDGMRQVGALQHARKIRHDTKAAAGNAGTILTVPDVAQAEFAGVAADDGKSGAADEGIEFAAEDFVAETNFAAAAGVISEIETASGTFVAEDGDASLSGKGIAGELGGEGEGRDEETAHGQGLVQLGGGKIAGAEKKIVAPLAAVVVDVHEGDASTAGDIEGGHARAVDVDGEIDEGRSVGFFVRHDA